MHRNSKNEISVTLFLYPLLAFILSFTLLQLNSYVTDDGTDYLRIAQNFIAGKGLSLIPGEPFTVHLPLYPLLTGIFSKVFFDNVEFAGHFVSILSFSLTLLPLFLLSQTIYGPKTAQWSCFLYLTSGFLLIYSNLILTEPLFIFLIMTLLWLVQQILEEENPRVWQGLALGINAELAYFTRPEGFFYYLVALASILLSSSKRSWRSKLRTALISLIPFLLLFLPYLNFFHKTTGHWQLSGGVLLEVIRRQLDVSHPGQYLEVKKQIEGLSTDKTQLKIHELAETFGLWHWIAADHFALLRSIPNTFLMRTLEFNRYFYAGLGFFLIGAGFLKPPWNPRRKKSEVLLILSLLPFVPHLIVVFDQRRYLPLYPIFLIWMGNGIESVRHWAQKSFNLNHRASMGIALSICLFLALPSAVYLRDRLGSSPVPPEHKEMGLWMKNHIPRIEEEKVTTHRGFVTLYSGAHVVFLPYVEKLEDLVTYMRHKNSRYFVVSEDLDTPVRDSYRSLLDENRPPPPGLTREHVIRGKTKVILYKLLAGKDSFGLRKSS